MKNTNFNLTEKALSTIKPVIEKIKEAANKYETPITVRVYHACDDEEWTVATLYAGIRGPEQYGRLPQKTLMLRAICNVDTMAVLQYASGVGVDDVVEFDATKEFDQDIWPLIEQLDHACKELDLGYLVECIYARDRKETTSSSAGNVPSDLSRVPEHFVVAMALLQKRPDFDRVLMEWMLGDDLRDHVNLS